ncbi:MAG TPA: Rap1a/Tai family immunity protein [Candidatus Angelobacter sp.]|jgi:hypothetical protein|nr:Rap1a/Tai family immunity protein [Candidatus Angelobacter sp.]
MRKALFLLFWVSGAKAFCANGTELLHWCKAAFLEHPTPESFILQGQCVGYIAGALDSYDEWRAALDYGTKYPSGNICAPEHIQNEQMMRVVLKYLNDNPAKLHLPASGLVTSAFIRAFPCKQPSDSEEKRN